MQNFVTLVLFVSHYSFSILFVFPRLYLCHLQSGAIFFFIHVCPKGRKEVDESQYRQLERVQMSAADAAVGSATNAVIDAVPTTSLDAIPQAVTLDAPSTLEEATTSEDAEEGAITTPPEVSTTKDITQDQQQLKDERAADELAAAANTGESESTLQPIPMDEDQPAAAVEGDETRPKWHFSLGFDEDTNRRWRRTMEVIAFDISHLSVFLI